ncbi:MAG: hypothetical protein ACT4PE_05540 [Candidatus Eiseniibacteriota bacterium]
MPSQGPFYPLTWASVAVPGSPSALAWTSPDGADLSDDSYAGCLFTAFVSDERSEYLRGVDVPFSMPLDAEIDGLTVAIERKELGSDVRDHELTLVYQGAAIGDDKAADGEWPASDTVATYGGTSDDWNAGLTPLILASPLFGVQLRVRSTSGAAPQALVDGITLQAAYTPATAGAGTGSKVRDRVRSMLRDFDLRRPLVDLARLDNAIAESHMLVAAMMKKGEAIADSAFTIAPGANTFSLPTTLNGRSSSALYDGELRLRRSRDGWFMRRRTLDQVDAMRAGLADGRRGPPTDYALWEESDGTVRGLCYPRADRAERIDLFYRSVPDDMRDAVDIDVSSTQMGRELRAGLVHLAAGTLALSLPQAVLARNGLTHRVARVWTDVAHRTIYSATAADHDVVGVGGTERLVS